MQKNAVRFINALDPQTHYSVAPDERFYGDLGFLGTECLIARNRVEEFFLESRQKAQKQKVYSGVDQGGVVRNVWIMSKF